MSAPLPGMPEPPSKTPKKVAVGIRATRIRAGRLCEQCCINIHLFGVGAAPYPRPARWRVTEGDVVQKLCEAHKDARCAAAT